MSSSEIARMLSLGGADSAALADVITDYFGGGEPDDLGLFTFLTLLALSKRQYNTTQCIIGSEDEHTPLSDTPFSDSRAPLSDTCSSMAEPCTALPDSDESATVFTDVELAVEEASDTVCNSGLEIGCVVVENDDTGDAEERRVARFLAGGCKCKLNDGNSCYLLFTSSQISSVRDDCRQLTKDQLDMVVMGQLRALCQRDSVTQKSKAINTGRKRTNTPYRYGGHRICQTTFLFLHNMSVTRFDSIKRSWLEKGLLPRVREKVVPHNTTKLSDIKNLVRFILQYAEEHAILLPGRIPGYKRDDIQLLPSSTTKREVWEKYHQAASLSEDTKAVCYLLFCALWNQLTPHVILTRPMSDLCWVCQQNSTLIMRAHNRPIEEKSEVSAICMYACINI